MLRYFFDTRDGDTFINDDVGAEVSDLEAAKALAAKALAELARDVVPGADRRVLTIEVRDAQGPVLEARLTFEAIILVSAYG
jgi:hypothetical protein